MKMPMPKKIKMRSSLPDLVIKIKGWRQRLFADSGLMISSMFTKIVAIAHNDWIVKDT